MKSFEMGEGNFECVYYQSKFNKQYVRFCKTLNEAKEEAYFMLNWFCAKRIFIYTPNNLILTIR